MSTPPESLLKSLVIAIAPIVFGTILTAGVLESFKNDTAVTKNVMDDFYRPMREAQIDCHQTHADLYKQYGAAAGTLQLMFNEFDHLAKVTPAKMTKNYEVLLESVLKTHMETSGKLGDLEKRLEACRANLMRRYEELAMITGTYDKYSKLVGTRVNEINKLYEQRKKSIQALKMPEFTSVWDMFRNFMQTRFDTMDEKLAASKRIDELSKPVIEAQIILSQTEFQMFEVEIKLFEGAHHLFSSEISNRFHRGFIARTFF